jgi:hypothetical protein
MDQDQAPHYCTGCGEMHGGEARETPEVAMARINRDADIKIARINAHQDDGYNETRVEVAEIEGAAEVAVAEATAEVVGEIIAAEAGAGDEEELPPVVVEAPAPETIDEEPSMEPKDELSDGPPAEKKTSFSYWP